MTLDDATKAIKLGMLFGDVYPFLTNSDDGEALKAWFVGTPGLPNLTARSRPPVLTGDTCQQCGSANLTWSGTCKLCMDCGDTSGGCG